MAHELGLEFDSDPGFDENQTPTAELLAANAMGQSPTIDDDGFALAESMAINLYLARKHGQLAPATLEDEAQTWRWSFWAMTAVEPGLLDVLKHKFGVMGYEQDDEAAKAAAEPLERPFNVLEQALEGRDYLLGDAFTVADLNVASVMAWGHHGRARLRRAAQFGGLARPVPRPGRGAQGARPVTAIIAKVETDGRSG